MEHVIILPFLFEESGRDSWLVILFSGFLFLIWMTSIYFVAKNTKQRPLRDYLTEKFGRSISTLFIGIGAAYSFFISTITIYDLTRWTSVTYLHGTPTFYIIIIFTFTCLLLSTSSILSIAIVNGLLLPIIIILGFLVSFGNIPNKDYSLLFPVFENGIAPYLYGSIYTGVGFFEIFAITFLHHKLRNNVRLIPLYLTGMTLILLMFGPTVGAITEFGPEASKNLSFLAFEEWRLLSFGRFIEHVDFLAIYQWYAGAFIRVSLGFYLIIELFQIKKLKPRNIWLTIIFILAVILAQIPVTSIEFYHLLKKWILPIGFWLLLCYSLTLTVLTFIKQEKGELNENEKMATKETHESR